MVIDGRHHLKEEQKMNELANRDQEMNQKLKTVLEEMEQSHPVQGLSPNGEAPLSFRTMGDLASSWLQERQDVVKKSTFSTYSYRGSSLDRTGRGSGHLLCSADAG